MSTPEQRLERVNQRRATRAQIKRGLASGTVDPITLMFDARAELDGFTVLELLSFVRGLPPRLVNAALDEFSIPLTDTVAELNAAKRADLARWLDRQGHPDGR
jgi:hypothetical protein